MIAGNSHPAAAAGIDRPLSYILVDMHPAALSDEDLLAGCDETRTRRSGPGGQHRNKVETAVVLRHRQTGLTAEASERRSQAENRRMALARLRLRLALEHREAAAGGPSELWQSRTRGRRLEVAITHRDYSVILAEACDQLEQAGWEPAAAAGRLGVTMSQLLRLFRRDPAAWTAFNRRRASLGLRPLA
jgi:hypothetical protein